MTEGQRRALLLGGVGVGLVWLLNQKPHGGAPSTVVAGNGTGTGTGSGSPYGSNGTFPGDTGGRTGSCPVYGQPYNPAAPVPSGCALGHDSNGILRYVDLH